MTVSPQLRKAGEIIARIGKEIEATGVEDGDPPFRITHKQAKAVRDAVEKVQVAMKHTTTDGEADDYGEDVMGLRPGHDLINLKLRSKDNNPQPRCWSFHYPLRLISTDYQVGRNP